MADIDKATGLMLYTKKDKIPAGVARVCVDYTFDPKIKFTERHKELSALDGEYSQSSAADSQLTINDLPNKLRDNHSVKNIFTAWKHLKMAEARTPKFTKWLASVAPTNKDLHEAVAKACQKYAEKTFRVSSDPNAIFNLGNSPSFYSCLMTASPDPNGYPTLRDGGFHSTVMRPLMEKAIGISVAYTTDGKGNITDRCCLHLIKNRKTKEVGIVAACWRSSSAFPEVVVKSLKTKHPDYKYFVYDYNNGKIMDADWKFEDCDAVNSHWDLPIGAKNVITCSVKEII